MRVWALSGAFYYNRPCRYISISNSADSFFFAPRNKSRSRSQCSDLPLSTRRYKALSRENFYHAPRYFPTIRSLRHDNALIVRTTAWPHHTYRFRKFKGKKKGLSDQANFGYLGRNHAANTFPKEREEKRAGKLLRFFTHRENWAGKFTALRLTRSELCIAAT